MSWFVQHCACASSYLVGQRRKSKKINADNLKNPSSDCGNEIFMLSGIKKQANKYSRSALGRCKRGVCVKVHKQCWKEVFPKGHQNTINTIHEPVVGFQKQGKKKIYSVGP